MRKITISATLLASVCMFPPIALNAKDFTASSPSGNIVLTVSPGENLSYSVKRDGKAVVDKAEIAMKLSGKTIGGNAKVKKSKTGKVNEVLTPLVPMKQSKIDNKCNTLTLTLSDGSDVEFRIYDNGVAHRFVTRGKAPEVEVLDEVFSVAFPSDLSMTLQQPGGFVTSYEDPYSHKKLSEWGADDRMSTLPVFGQSADGYCVLVSESDLSDYPCMFLKGNGVNGFTATFPKVPAKYGPNGDRSLRIEEEAPYIAKTAGARAYPWRYMVIGEPAEIVEQTMTAQLAPKPAVVDTSWIKPGQVIWEWWNGAIPYGDDVDFVAGCNTDTYKYYIDFAAKNGIEYILLDEGWAKDTRDPFTPNDNLNLQELIKYGNEKGIGIFLWLTWLTAENNFDLLEKFADWGIKGVKIDFMDRSDQWMVNFYERVMREAAKNKLMVDFHGAFKPAGLEQKYPNLLSYEGVLGMEMMGGCKPSNSIYYPFVRNAVGPMDYTPGAMISMQPDCFESRRPNSASIGTRAYQLALYVLFESGIQMLADNPTLYNQNQACTDFISSVPVAWDETRALEARPGEVVAVAKRKGDTWYIGVMTADKDWSRELNLPLDFLAPGVTYNIVSFEDGPNANVQAMDYRRRSGEVDSSATLPVKLARNGGYAAVLTPQK